MTTLSSGNFFLKGNEHHVILLPELMNVTGWPYNEAYQWSQALRVDQGWPSFEKVCVDSSGKTVYTLAVPLSHFISICCRLPYLYPKSDEPIMAKLGRLFSNLAPTLP